MSPYHKMRLDVINREEKSSRSGSRRDNLCCCRQSRRLDTGGGSETEGDDSVAHHANLVCLKEILISDLPAADDDGVGLRQSGKS